MGNFWNGKNLEWEIEGHLPIFYLPIIFYISCSYTCSSFSCSYTCSSFSCSYTCSSFSCSYTCSSFTNIIPFNWFRLAHLPMFYPSKLFLHTLCYQLRYCIAQNFDGEILMANLTHQNVLLLFFVKSVPIKISH